MKRMNLLGVLLVSVLIGGFLLAYPSGLFSQDSESAELFRPLPVPKAGGLPDEQERQLSGIRNLQTTLDVFLAEIRSGAFQSKSVTLNVGGGKALHAVTNLVEKRSGSDFTWFGTIPNAAVPGDAIMVVKSGRVTGTIQAGNELYEVVPLDSGRHAIVKVDQSKFPPDELFDISEGLESLQAASDVTRLKSASSPWAYETDSDPNTVYPLRVIVAYTEASKKAAGSKADVESKIQLAVATANKSYQNSKINIRMELVHCYETNYSETGKSDDDIKRFAGKNDGFLDEVHGLRQQHSANVAALLVNKMDSCGRAAAIGAQADTAFCVVLFECLANHSLAHEIGHLQGAQHDWEAHPLHQEGHPASHGFWHKGVDPAENWSTIMSYGCAEGCPRVPYWSNPDIAIKGMRTGSKECCNNAAVLRSTAKKMSTFK